MNNVFVLAGNGEVRHYTGGYADYRADVEEQRQRLAAQQRLDSQPLPNSSPKKHSEIARAVSQLLTGRSPTAGAAIRRS